MGDLVSASCNSALFDFFAVNEIHSILRRNHTSIASSFLFFFADVLKWSRPRNHMISTEHFFLSGWKSIYLLVLISLSVNSYLHALFLMCPSLDIKVTKYWNLSLCLHLILFIKMLICGHSLFWLKTIAFDFLLCKSNPFLLQQCIIIVASLFFYFLH